MAEKGECKGNTGDEVNDVKGKQLKTSTFAGISSDIFNGTDSKSGTKERQFGYEDQPLTCDPLPDLTENQRVVLYTVYLCRDDRDYIDLDDDAVSMGEIDVRKTVEELEDRGLMKRVRVSDNRSLSRIPCDKLLEIMESYMENCLLRDIDKDFFIHVISDYSLYCYIIDFFTLYRDDSSPQDSRSVTLMRLMMEGRMDVVLRTISHVEEWFMPKQISTDSQDFVQFWKNQCCRWNIHPTDWSNGVFDTEIERCFSAYTILSGYQKEFWELVLHKRQWSILILILMSEKYSVLYEEKLLEEKVERIQQTFLTLNGSDDGISDNTLLIQELINKNKILTRNREERLEFKSENIRTLVMGYFSLNCLKTDDDYTNYIKLSSFDSVLEYVRTVDYEDDIKGNLERLKEMNERRESGIDILSSSDSISSSYSMFDYDRKRYLYFPRKMEETLVRESGIDIVRHCIVTQKRIQHFVSDILNIPTEILNWDYEARCRYVKCAKKGTQSIHRARAMIVGCAGAGKTTLLKRLQKKSLDEFQNTQSTIGLEVHEDIFEISKENDFLKALTEETDKEGKQLLSVMDFGGQCVYYACHQVYLSRRAFYLQVIDMSKSFSEKVDPALCEQEETMFADWTYGEYLLFWLKSVHTYCDRDAPVIIVGTHLDKVKDQNSDTFYNSILEHLQFNKHLKKHLDRKRCFVLGFQTDGVSNSDSLSELEKCIVAIAKEDRWRETIPSDWALCEIVFRENRRRKTRLALLEDISYKCFGGNEEKIFQIRDVLKFYHDIGVVLYFNDKNLSETVIIDIQWFIDFFTNIITDPNHIRDIAENNSDWENFYRSGHIPDRLLTCLWNERYLEFDLWHRYEKKTNLLHYMQRLGLFVIGTDAHYIPCMNKRAFGIKEEAYFQSLQTKTSVLVFRFQFLPFFLYYRLIVACLTRTNEEWGTLEDNGLCLYKNVACFAYKQHVVALAVNNSSIQLQIFQQTNCNVLVMKEVALKVRDTVESLLKDLLGNFHTRIDMYTVGYQCCKQEVFREHDDCFVEEKVIYKKGKIPCPRHGLINHHTLCESSLLVYWKLGVKAEISDLDDLLDQDECTRLSEPELRKLNFKTFKKLTKLGRDALQLYFDRLFPPVDLVTTLTTNKDNLKCGQYKMNEDQCTLLFPADKSIPTSSTFDITIMYKLLRNYGPYLLPPSNGWGKKPEIGQKLPTDDVERIRIYRNEMEHKTQTSNVMEKDDFDLKWKDLSQAILRLSNGSLKQDIISLRRQS